MRILIGLTTLLAVLGSVHSVVVAQQLAADDQGDGSARIELIDGEPVRELLSAGPATRRPEVLEDAGLNDVAVAGRYCWAVGERGVVCLSVDDGRTWLTRALPFDCRLTSVCFLTNRRGWIGGIQVDRVGSPVAVLLSTDDGGQTWRDLSGTDGSLPGILQLQFFGLEEAIAVTLPAADQRGATLFRTRDGGESWEPVPTDRARSLWLGAGFWAADAGVVAGLRQGLGVLTGNEAIVLQQAAGGLRSLRAVSTDGTQSGWVGGDGVSLLQTDDSGVSWQPPAGDLPVELRDLFDIRAICHRGEVVVAAGDPAQLLLYSDDGGGSWQQYDLPAAGRIQRIRRCGSQGFMAVGSFGQVLRSENGRDWSCVRGSGRHAAVLSVGGTGLQPQSLMLARLSADGGLRSAVWQAVSVEPAVGVAALFEESEWQGPAATTALGGSDYGVDWQLLVSDGGAGLTEERLLENLNRQTDGRAEELLSLRLARQIRSYRPTVVVIESAGETDGLSAVLQRLMPQAVALAADADDVRLSEVLADGWQVQRVLVRRRGGRSTALLFSAADLLRSEGTTAGLLGQAALDLWPGSEVGLQATAGARDQAVYDVLLDSTGEAGIRSAFDGLEGSLTTAVKRARVMLDRESLQQAAVAIRDWRVESGVLTGAASAEQSAESFVASLEQAGERLPTALAKQQLREAARAALGRGNLEGWLAIQQELIRRFPGTAEAWTASEGLLLVYGSAELDVVRRGATHDSSAEALEERDPGEFPGGTIVQPVIQPAAASGFGGQRTRQHEALRELWDANERTAWRLLTEASGGRAEAGLSPAAVLRHAITLRRQEQFGAATSLLAGLSVRDDDWGVWARSEQQLTQGLKSEVFRQVLLSQSAAVPVLDGRLTDPIWEEAEEVRLVTVAGDQSSDDSLCLLAWDDRYLYVSARVPRAAGERAAELAENRYYDESHADRDRVEISIDVDRDRSTQFRLSVDESGRTSDSCWLIDRWNPRWFVAVDQDDAAWRLELAIPLQELHTGGVDAGTLWSVGIRRLLPGIIEQRTQSLDAEANAGPLLVRFARER